MHADLLANRVDGLTTGAVFDVVPDAAAEVAGRLGVRSADTPESLIEGDDVDVVAICSSTDTHIDLLVFALNRVDAGFRQVGAVNRIALIGAFSDEVDSTFLSHHQKLRHVREVACRAYHGIIDARGF